MTTKLLHGSGRGGRVIIAAKDRSGRWYEHAVDLANLPVAVCALRGHRDTYLTFNRFNDRRRLITRLRGLDALYVDLDTYKLPPRNPTASMAPEGVADAVLRHLRQKGLPVPSLVTFPGRGLCAC